MRGKLVDDDPRRQTPLVVHQPAQQTLGSLGVAAGLDDLVENIAALLDGAPARSHDT